MKKQVVVIHGGEAWDSYEEYIKYLQEYDFSEDKFAKITKKRWKDNLQDNLGKNYQVVKPQMPSKRNAKYIEWKIWFEKFFPFLGDDTILIGHSLGVIFLIKYLAEELLPFSVKQLHLVAGVFGCKGGFGIPTSLEKVEDQCKEIFIYHSKDDFVVDFEDGQKYAKALPSAKFIKFENRNHFLQSEFPEIVQNIKNS